MSLDALRPSARKAPDHALSMVAGRRCRTTVTEKTARQSKYERPEGIVEIGATSYAGRSTDDRGAVSRLTFLQRHALTGSSSRRESAPTNRCPRMTGIRTGGSRRSRAPEGTLKSPDRVFRSRPRRPPGARASADRRVSFASELLHVVEAVVDVDLRLAALRLHTAGLDRPRQPVGTPNSLPYTGQPGNRNLVSGSVLQRAGADGGVPLADVDARCGSAG